MVNTLSEFDIVIRLSLGFLAGGIIGFERSSRRQVAGLRTHILIAVGSCCLMLLSIWLPQHLGSGNGDPGRIAAQVVSGIGFLGAGAIIRLGDDVKGLTTAASLWLVAAIGMTIGAGMYVAALAAEVLAIVALMLNSAERKIFPYVKDKILELHYSHYAEHDIDAVLLIFKNFSIQYQSLDIQLNQNNSEKARARFSISILESTDISKLAKALELCGDIDRVEIKEKV